MTTTCYRPRTCHPSKQTQRTRGFQGVPDLELYLDGIERHHFGGTCYANNSHLHGLLLSLGYETKLCGANMSNSDVHLVCVVTIDGREYLVDVGYAAPFREPMPRDLPKDYTIEHGNDRYVLRPQDANGCSRLNMYRGGVLKHGYLATPKARELTEFDSPIADSYGEDATFMNSLLLARYTDERSVVIHNLTVTVTESRTPTRTVTWTLGGTRDLAPVVSEHFGILADVTDAVVDSMSRI